MRKKKSTGLPVKTMKAFKTKTPYSKTITAIEKKMEEIKLESAKRGAINNNLTLFRYLLV
jgi:hypothetical protein